MTLKSRLSELERIAHQAEPFRVVNVPNGADQDAAREQYRQETGYRGAIVILDETDRAL
jgi:DnaJ-domain-containing protein 1